MENHTRICLFVIALKLWHRLACSCVYSPSLIFFCHVHDAVAEPASECFCLPLWHEEFDNPWLVCDDTEQLVPWLHCIGRKYVLVVYTVRHRHSFQSFDILDQYTSIHVTRYTSKTTFTCLLPVLVSTSNTPSATTWNVAPEGNFNLCRTVIPSKMLVAFSGYFSMTAMRRSNCWESLALLVWSFAGVHKNQQETKEEDQEGRWKKVSCQSDETVREVLSEQTHHDPYEEEVLDPCCEPYTQPS